MKTNTIRFLSNESLWREIKQRVAKAKRVYAAVAYLGTDGSNLLPLKKGHKLVVDMSLDAVRQGATNPSEIRTLFTRGVEVFSRGSLHAKFLIIDKTLIVSSANISKNSESKLDEVGILTTDAAIVQRAITFFNALCTEPVRQIYLKQCINEYHPPKFKAAAESSRRKTGRSTRIVEAKLWFVGGLVFGGIPEKEKEQAEGAEDRARKLLKREKGTYVDQFHYPSKKRFMQHIRSGDWIVACIGEDKKKQVYPPEQILNLDNYLRGHGRRRYLIHTEACNNGEPMRLNMFRRKIMKIVPTLDKDHPRTQPIENTDDADAILRLWTTTGRIARKH